MAALEHVLLYLQSSAPCMAAATPSPNPLLVSAVPRGRCPFPRSRQGVTLLMSLWLGRRARQERALGQIKDCYGTWLEILFQSCTLYHKASEEVMPICRFPLSSILGHATTSVAFLILFGYYSIRAKRQMFNKSMQRSFQVRLCYDSLLASPSGPTHADLYPSRPHGPHAHPDHYPSCPPNQTGRGSGSAEFRRIFEVHTVL